MISHYRLLHLPHQKTKYLSILYLASTLRVFVFSFLFLFIPIVVFQRLNSAGYDNQNSLILVSFAFLIFYFVNSIGIYLTTKVNYRYGIKWGFIVGQAFLLAFFYLIKDFINLPLLFGSFALFGLASAFWWTSYHTYFLELGKKSVLGEEVSILQMIGILSGAVAPIIGGIIITKYGAESMFMFSLLINAFSFFILFFIKDIQKLDKVKFRDVLNEMSSRRRDFVTGLGMGAEDYVLNVIWPLVLFLFIKNYIGLGEFSTLVAVVSALFAFMIGRWTDKKSKIKIQKVGAGSRATVWALKAIAPNIAYLFFLTIGGTLTSLLLYIPLDTIMYRHANAKKRQLYIAFREMSYKAGSMIAISIAMIFISFGASPYILLLLGSGAVLMTFVLRD